MKHFACIIAVILLPAIVSAQSTFKNAKEGSSLEYTTVDAKGKLLATHSLLLEKITNTDSGKILHIVTQSEAKESKQKNQFSYSENLTENQLTINKDMYAAMGSMISEMVSDTAKVKLKTTVTGDDVVYKISPEINEILPAYKINIKIEVNKMTFPVSVECSDRKCIRKEKMTIPVGTFETCVIEEKTSVSFKIMGIKKTELEMKEIWFAPEIGVIKEVTYDKKKKIKSTEVLSKINYK